MCGKGRPCRVAMGHACWPSPRDLTSVWSAVSCSAPVTIARPSPTSSRWSKCSLSPPSAATVARSSPATVAPTPSTFLESFSARPERPAEPSTCRCEPCGTNRRRTLARDAGSAGAGESPVARGAVRAIGEGADAYAACAQLSWSRPRTASLARRRCIDRAVGRRIDPRCLQEPTSPEPREEKVGQPRDPPCSCPPSHVLHASKGRRVAYTRCPQEAPTGCDPSPESRDGVGLDPPH